MAMEGKPIKLNPAQKAAVEHKSGPLLVVAGAGTGKTSVIINRLVELINSGVERKHILALTFTEKAAQEMLDRASEQLNESYGVELNIYTFNAFGAERLSEFAIEIGLSNNQKLIGDNGKIVLLRENLDALGLDYFAPISRPDGQLASIADYFSKLKQQLVKPNDYLKFVQSMPSSSEEEKLDKKRHSELAHAYKTYQDIMRSRNIIDYDDQIYLLIELLESRHNILKLLQERYPYIMIDEFQDTNPMQSKLIDLLAGKQQNIFVVGDDDQSIYGWRGATLANILDFNKRYPKSKEVTLIENFRSTQNILDSAWHLIQFNNPNRLEFLNKLDKKLKAFRGKGSDIKVQCFARLDAELNWVAEDIKRKLDAGVEPGDIAVLARSKNTVGRVHRMLESHSVEHTVSGVSSDLYQHPVVATLLEALRCVTDESNNMALYHTLTGRLFRCDPQLLSERLSKSRYQHEPLASELSEIEDDSIKQAMEQIATWRSQAHGSIRELAYNILTDSGFKEELYRNAQDSDEATEDVLALGQWFDTLYDFEKVSTLPSAISYLDSLEALRADGETLADDSANIVTTLPAVMTVHKAKGLEWKVVYVVDLTEYSFPLKKSGEGLQIPDALSQHSAADDHYNEERRLMYVATTRARDELILSYSLSHNGTTKRKPSRFLNEMFEVVSEELTTVKSMFQLDMTGSPTHKDKFIELPSSMRQNGNVILTASQADDYLNCPLNFYYKHVLNVPEVPTAQTAVGSLLHSIIQEINGAKKDAKELPSLESLIQRLKSEWPKAGYSSKLQQERAVKLGLSSLEKLYERLSNEPAPVAVEEPFKIHIPNTKLILKGRIDAVVPDGKGVQIKDYKTSTSVQTPEKAKSKTTGSNQLVMYALAWRLLRDEDPVSVSLDYIQTGQIGVVNKRKDSLDKMQDKLASAAQDILDGKYPLGYNHELCLHPL